ncbi:hypothetical protein DOY81_008598, partial [Sarcophaga bullata]
KKHLLYLFSIKGGALLFDMQLCSFCLKNSEKVQNINENNINCRNSVIKIQNLLNIFQDDIVQSLVGNNKLSFICPQCLKQLKKCYEFVQQLKDSQLKLQKGKEITTEHDYFGVPSEEQIGNETVSVENVTVKREDPKLIDINIKYKPILPMPPDKVFDVKETSTSLSGGKSRLYKCLKCEELFKAFKALKTHEKSYCKYTAYEEFQACKYCHKCYAKEGLLKEHISLKHSQGEYLCCLCENKSFAGKGYLARHIEKMHQHKSLQYYCGQCQQLQSLV